MFDQIIPETQTVFTTVSIGFGLIILIAILGEIIRDVVIRALKRSFERWGE